MQGPGQRAAGEGEDGHGDARDQDAAAQPSRISAGLRAATHDAMWRAPHVVQSSLRRPP